MIYIGQNDPLYLMRKTFIIQRLQIGTLHVGMGGWPTDVINLLRLNALSYAQHAVL